MTQKEIYDLEKTNKDRMLSILAVREASSNLQRSLSSP